jgi:lauroyl/myristoyl acyltransferase
MEDTTLKSPQNQDEYEIFEEKLLVKSYHSSEALKDDIGKIITTRHSMNWDFVKMNSKGPFLTIVFRQRSI